MQIKRRMAILRNLRNAIGYHSVAQYQKLQEKNVINVEICSDEAYPFETPSSSSSSNYWMGETIGSEFELYDKLS